MTIYRKADLLELFSGKKASWMELLFGALHYSRMETAKNPYKPRAVIVNYAIYDVRGNLVHSEPFGLMVVQAVHGAVVDYRLSAFPVFAHDEDDSAVVDTRKERHDLVTMSHLTTTAVAHEVLKTGVQGWRGLQMWSRAPHVDSRSLGQAPDRVHKIDPLFNAEIHGDMTALAPRMLETFAGALVVPGNTAPQELEKIVINRRAASTSSAVNSRRLRGLSSRRATSKTSLLLHSSRSSRLRRSGRRRTDLMILFSSPRM